MFNTCRRHLWFDSETGKKSSDSDMSESECRQRSDVLPLTSDQTPGELLWTPLKLHPDHHAAAAGKCRLPSSKHHPKRSVRDRMFAQRADITTTKTSWREILQTGRCHGVSLKWLDVTDLLNGTRSGTPTGFKPDQNYSKRKFWLGIRKASTPFLLIVADNLDAECFFARLLLTMDVIIIIIILSQFTLRFLLQSVHSGSDVWKHLLFLSLGDTTCGRLHWKRHRYALMETGTFRNGTRGRKQEASSPF